MTIEIDFEIGDNVWFIHPAAIKAVSAKLLAAKAHVTEKGVKIKYHVDCRTSLLAEKTQPEVYVWNIFKTKEDLLKSL